jgi:hypothetical protein
MAAARMLGRPARVFDANPPIFAWAVSAHKPSRALIRFAPTQSFDPGGFKFLLDALAEFFRA